MKDKNNSKKDNMNSPIKSFWKASIGFIRNHIPGLVLFIILLAILVLESIILYDNPKCNIKNSECTSGFIYGTREALTNFYITLSDNYYVNNILIIAFPLVDTILAMSITLPKDSIYGISVVDFRNLRLNVKYSLLGMILFSIILLAISIVFYYVGLVISSLYLNLIAFIYIVSFLISEVPLLTRNTKTIEKIIKHAYKASNFEITQYGHMGKGATKFEADTMKVVANMLAETGIEYTFNVLGVDTKHIGLNRLCLITQSTYNVLLSIILDDIENKSSLINGIEKDIEFYFEKFEQLKIKEKDKHRCAEIGNLICLYHQFLEQLGMINTNEISTLVTIYRIVPSSEFGYTRDKDHRNYIYNLSNYVLTRTLLNEELWYVELILSSFNNYIVCNKPEERYLVFISIYLYYILKAPWTSDSFKFKVQNFCKGEWGKRLENYIRILHKNSDQWPEILLFDVLPYFKATDSWTKWEKDNIYTDFTRFDLDYIVRWCLELLYIKDNITYSYKECTNPTITKSDYLTNDEKKALLKALDDFTKNGPKLSGYFELYNFTVDKDDKLKADLHDILVYICKEEKPN